MDENVFKRTFLKRVMTFFGSWDANTKGQKTFCPQENVFKRFVLPVKELQKSHLDVDQITSQKKHSFIM